MISIEKVKNYNQRAFAVLVTALVLLAVVGLIAMTSFFVSELFWENTSYENNVKGILADKAVSELQQENKRKQVISYDKARLVDSLNLVYIIPVSHKTLHKAEAISGENPTHQVKKLWSSSGSFREYYDSYSGNFNNLLVYDYKAQKTQKLFAGRVHFQGIRTAYFADDILLLLQVATEDSSKDGLINQSDYRHLFVYSLKSNKLNEVSLDGADASEMEFVGETKDLIINFGIDQDKDGQFNSNIEPSLVKRYDYTQATLADIVPLETNKQLQMQLDGSKE